MDTANQVVARELESMLGEINPFQLALQPHWNLQRVIDVQRIAIAGNFEHVRLLAEDQIEAATRNGLHPPKQPEAPVVEKTTIKLQMCAWISLGLAFTLCAAFALQMGNLSKIKELREDNAELVLEKRELSAVYEALKAREVDK